MKKRISDILFVLGALPFLFLFIQCVYAAIDGYSSIFMSYLHHGWNAFMYYLIDNLKIFWLHYIIGLILMIFSFVLKKGR